MTDSTTVRVPTTARRVANALKRTITGPMWHGPSLQEVLADVSAEQAAAHPIPGAHSIWELVLHIGAWADISRERLDGRAGAGDVAAERNFPPIGDPTDARWRAAIASMETSYRDLAAATAAISDETLFAILPERDHTAFAMLQGVVEHGTYHGGQIALLKKA